MRRWPLLALPLLTLLPAAGALATCLPPACVPAHTSGFAPPVLVLQDGESVEWETLDIQHTSTEDQSMNVEQPCFSTAYFLPLRPRSDTVTFTVEGGHLFATQEGEETLPCTSAEPLPGGALVTYNCRLHPWMVGALVVLDS